MSTRGTTHVPDAVIAKVISQAASEVAEVGSSSGGVLGVGQRRDFSRRPRVDVELFGATALVTIDLGLLYPSPLETTAERIREVVTSRLARDVGIHQAQIDIHVSWLHPAEPTVKRRLK